MRSFFVIVALLGVFAGSVSGRQVEEQTRDASGSELDAMAARAIAYLRSAQDSASGGWNHDQEGINLPAVTGLVLIGMLNDPAIDGTDPAVERGVTYILGFRQPDGGIYDRILPSYNTAICISALSRLDGAGSLARDAAMTVDTAVPFLKGLQFSEIAIDAGEAGLTTDRVDRDHPYYGGIGYGRNGRPDNSNLHFMLEALEDAGVPGDDPAVQRALVFLQRTQMLDGVNDMPYAEGSRQGGFIYATSPNKDSMGVGESKAGTIEETLSDGSVASRLRAYGSMTYAGFKSYAYAKLDADDPRVAAAFDWIRRNYTLEENPGIGTNGLYYFFMTFSKAMEATGLDALGIEYRASPMGRSPRGTLALEASSGDPLLGVTARFVPVTVDGDYDYLSGYIEGAGVASLDESTGEYIVTSRRDWRDDLATRLSRLQNEDGSFRSVDDRWMENDPVLITAYALIAIQHARGYD